jgi:hypothetical protein
MRVNRSMSIAAAALAAAALLSGCTSKKVQFKKEMTAWLKTHPSAGEYCTSFRASAQPTMIPFTPMLGAFTQVARFYEPSPAFNTDKTVFAIQSADDHTDPAFREMVKLGLLKAVPVDEVDDTIALRPIPHSYKQLMIHHYAVHHEIFYFLTGKAAGFQKANGSDTSISVSPIHHKDTTPLVLKTDHVKFAFGPPQWCGGIARITKVDLYTIPATEGGVITSNVTATAVPVGLPSWLFNPAVEKALNPPPSKTYKARGSFEKTSNGWTLQGGVQIVGLGNGPLGGGF